MTKQIRDGSLDSIGAILIIYMIIGHAFQWTHTQSNQFYVLLQRFLFFFLAFFFYKSGMFYRKSSMKIVVQKGIKKFLIPFCVYMVIGEIVRCIRLNVQEGDTSIVHYVVNPIISIVGRGGPSGDVPLWFLLALFSTQLVVALSDKYHIPKIYLFVFSIICAGLGSFLDFVIPPLIYETFLGVIFFIIGIYMKDLQYDKKVFVVSLVIYLSISIFIPSFVDFRKNSVSHGYWGLWVVSSITGIIVFINLFKYVFSNRLLSKMGQYSMQFFSFHWILFDVVFLFAGWPIIENGKVFGDFFDKNPNWTAFYTLLFVSIITLPLYACLVSMLKKRDIKFAHYL